MTESLMHKYYSFALLILISSCAGVSKKTRHLYRNTVIVEPGKIVQIHLPDYFEGKNINCSNGNFPVSQEAKPFYIYAESYFSDMKEKKCLANNVEIKIVVREKQFPYEELKVDHKKVNLNKKDLARVVREQKILNKVYSNQSSSKSVKDVFKLPLNSKITSDYGKRRLFNNQRKGQHLGIDFRANVGKPVSVANNGQVVLAKDLFYTGNTVIVYHGLGIFTVYGHLSKINVKENEKIKKGQILGLAGMTGRVTGPHLHWGVKVNGQWVNGKDLLSLKF